MVEWTEKKKGISTAMVGSERVEFGEWCTWGREVWEYTMSRKE
jgi:hypothetical protein